MKIVSTSVYDGPNIYALFPVIRHIVDLGELEDWPTAKIGKEFIDNLIDCLPGLQEHGCSYRTEGGFIRRMREDEGTWMGHVLEHMSIELQNIAGSDVTFGKTRSTENHGEYTMVFEFESREVGLAASQLALDLIEHLLPLELKSQKEREEPFDFETERDDFIRYAQRRALGPSTLSLVKAAEERNIPWLRLNSHSLIQFGHGRYHKRIQATITSETSYISVELASDKDETNKILAGLGLPVPRQELVYNLKAAKRAAQRIGFPVVAKPLDGNHGRGVSTNLLDNDQLEVAYEKAKEHSNGIIVESYIEGLDHRMLVINGELIAVAKRMPGHVVGDGKSSIEKLVDEINADPRRGVGHEKVLTRLEFDHQAERLLGQAGLDKDSVLPDGEIFYLRSTGNLSTGGTSIDVTDIVHPDNREMATRAIKAIGLDVGGVDFLSADISQSYREIGGGICEINAAPGFRMHVAPSEGKPRDVAAPVINMLFPPETKTRIPIAAITGTNGKTTTSRMLGHIFKLSGHTVGMTSTDGVYINGELSVAGDMTGPTSARMILRDPSVDVAVLETARGGILRAGLGYNYSNVSACLNVTADHLGLRGINTVEELAEVKRIVVEVAQDVAVLNADDSLCLQMAEHCKAKRLCYITMNHNHPLVKEHIKQGGMAVVLEEGMNGHMIAIYDNHHIPLLWTHLIPATLEGRALHNVQNAMFASAMAYSMDVPLEDIRHGLRTFNTSFFQAPGRMNIFDEHPFRVIIDYAHNAAAVKTMCQVVDNLDVEGKRILVFSAPGDRRDEDINEMAAIAANHFDHYICRRDDSRRGRDEREVPLMLSKALIENGVSEDKISIIINEVEANEAGLRMAEAGDLVMLFCDAINRTWKQIVHFKPEDDVSNTIKESSNITELQINEYLNFSLDKDIELITDERGVRIASKEEDD